MISEGHSVSELWYGRTLGVDVTELTPDQIQINWDQIVDRKRYKEVADPYDGCAGFTLTPRSYPGKN